MKTLDFSFQSISLKVNNKANTIIARPLTRVTVSINHFLTHVIEKWYLFPFNQYIHQQPSISTGSFHFLPLKFRAGRKYFKISLLDPGYHYLRGVLEGPKRAEQSRQGVQGAKDQRVREKRTRHATCVSNVMLQSDLDSSWESQNVGGKKTGWMSW